MSDLPPHSERWARLRERTRDVEPSPDFEDRISRAIARRESTWSFGIASLAFRAVPVGALLVALALVLAVRSERVWNEAVVAELSVPEGFP